jgi:glyoxylase-like metal-dependent hydrolase (beta-lactamase superfamily II)
MLAEDWDLATNPKERAPRARPLTRDMVVKGGDTLKVGTTEFKFVHTPGHIEGGLSFELTVFDNRAPRARCRKSSWPAPARSSS